MNLIGRVKLWQEDEIQDLAIEQAKATLDAAIYDFEVVLAQPRR
jgi:hypothetical protein